VVICRSQLGQLAFQYGYVSSQEVSLYSLGAWGWAVWGWRVCRSGSGLAVVWVPSWRTTGSAITCSWERSSFLMVVILIDLSEGDADGVRMAESLVV